MRFFFLSLISLLLFTAASAQNTKVIYTCPMHPEVQSSRPGNCPKCGMTLEKKTIKVSAPKQAPKKTTPQKKPAVKKTVKQKKPAATKPKTPVKSADNGANHMVKEQPKTDGEKAQTRVIYTCPMHPEVQEEKPGKCPKCGMDLVKKTITTGATTEHEMDGDHQPIETSGTVDMSIGKTVRVDLYVRDTIVNYTGKNKKAIAINGSIPAPTLEFYEGDTAEIHLHNGLKEETSLHWHGIILPNQFDGVPLLTTKRIGPGDSYVYKFRIVQNGTYWYHSHSALQEQVGMYGALILKKRNENEMDHATMLMPINRMVQNKDTGRTEGKMVYTCPMHPEVQQDKPGKCPKCGMALVKKTITNGIQQPKAMDMQHNMHNADGNPVIKDTTPLKHYNVVLSEWTDANPMQVQRRLRTANDWFSIKKGSTQSYSEAIKEGHFKTKFVNEWKRMKAMDVSDVFYEKFLVNGKPVNNETQFKAGDKVKLHVVNAGASSYFWLTYGGGKITVVGNDGNDVMPVEVDRLIVSVAETYDVVVTIPDNKSYEFRATSEDRTGFSSLWLGTGSQVQAPALPRLKYFEGMKMMNDMMRTNGTMKDMGMNMSLQQMDMNAVMYPEITGGTGDEGAGNNPKSTDMQQHEGHDMSAMTGDIVTLNYNMLSSPHKTSLPEERTRVLHFTLTGNMNRYLWTLDNKTVTETDRILINRGEVLRLVITNNSMMRHPMHLHGHDFRVINDFGEYSPLKNVIDVMPMETDTIEFAANQDGNWFFHCHILYHMMAGMGRVFKYNNSAVNPDLPNDAAAYRQFKKHPDQNMRHLMAKIGLESNGSDGEAMYSTNRYALITEWRIGTKKHHGIESETYFGRYLGMNQWWLPYIGFDYHHNEVENTSEKNMFGQQTNQNNRKTFTVGVQYLTPWLFFADARIDGKGKLRFQLSREDIPLTPRLRLAVLGNTDKEYMTGLSYVLTKWLALSTHYDSDMGYGAGITITY